MDGRVRLRADTTWPSDIRYCPDQTLVPTRLLTRDAMALVSFHYSLFLHGSVLIFGCISLSYLTERGRSPFLRGRCVVRLVGRRTRARVDVNKRILCCDLLGN